MIVFLTLTVSLMIDNEVPLLTIVKDNPLLTIVNNNPSLTIINEEMRREETALKGISTYH